MLNTTQTVRPYKLGDTGEETSTEIIEIVPPAEVPAPAEPSPVVEPQPIPA